MSPDEFDNHEIKPEKLHWAKVGTVLVAETTLGRYTIKQQHHLYFHGLDMTSQEYLGKFQDPKAKARKHFNEDAL